MRRFFPILVVAALCGCGVNVSKPSGAEKAPAPPPQKEIYDKVAPMPREVKTPPGKSGVEKPQLP